MIHDKKTVHGLKFALTAYLCWGIAPIYFKAIAEVPAVEVLAHRVIWSLALLGAVTFMTRGRLRQPPATLLGTWVWPHLASAALLSTNWLVFIYAIQTQRLVEASLGYFINPLVSVLLGVVVLGERLSRRQIIAVSLAAGGISAPLLAFGRFSWIAVALALSFGLYGVLRKRLDTDALTSLSIETLLAAPFALCYLCWLYVGDRLYFGKVEFELTILLALSGVVTAAPLVLFIEGVRRLRLATIGLLQNIVPSLQFVLAVFFYGEQFELIDGITFGCIWLALFIYGSDTLAYRGSGPANDTTATKTD